MGVGGGRKELTLGRTDRVSVISVDCSNIFFISTEQNDGKLCLCTWQEQGMRDGGYIKTGRGGGGGGPNAGGGDGGVLVM